MGIDPALLERRLDELYEIGAEPDGGAYRPLYGPAWATAVERVERWLKDAGLKPRRDAVGNLWGRAEGTDKGKSIVTGSHIDTVRHGGRLDGALGIVAGLTAVQSLLKAKGKPRRPLEVVAICEEEGSRFATSFWGSRAVTGAIDTVDAEIAAAMQERGLDPTKIASAARDDIDTFVELHIEQGAVLETSNVPLAVVGAIVGTAGVVGHEHDRAVLRTLLTHPTTALAIATGRWLAIVLPAAVLALACTVAVGGTGAALCSGLIAAAAVGSCALAIVLPLRNGAALALFLFMAVAGTVAPERLVGLATPGFLRVTAASALELGPALWHYRYIAIGDGGAVAHGLAWAGLGILLAAAFIGRRNDG